MNPKRGIIQLIVIVVLGITVLSLLGVQLSKLTDNPILRDNLSFAWRLFQTAWGSYIKPVGSYFLEQIKNLSGKS